MIGWVLRLVLLRLLPRFLPRRLVPFVLLIDVVGLALGALRWLRRSGRSSDVSGTGVVGLRDGASDADRRDWMRRVGRRGGRARVG